MRHPGTCASCFLLIGRMLVFKERGSWRFGGPELASLLTRRWCILRLDHLPLWVSVALSPSLSVQSGPAQLVLACCSARKEVAEPRRDSLVQSSPTQPPTQLSAVRKQQINAFLQEWGEGLRGQAAPEVRYQLGV